VWARLTNKNPRYPKIPDPPKAQNSPTQDTTSTEVAQTTNWAGLIITGVSLTTFIVLWTCGGYFTPNKQLLLTGTLLLLYRWAKEIKTSWS